MNFTMQFFGGPPAEQIGWTLVHSVWQGTLVAVLLATGLRLLRNRSAEARYIASSAALLTIVVCVQATAWLTIHNAVGERRPADSPKQTTAVAETAVPKTEADAVVQKEPPVVSPEASLEAISTGTPVVPLPTSTALSAAPRVEPTVLESFRAFVDPLLPWLVCGWLIGVLICSIRLLAAWQHVRTLRRIGVTPASQRFLESAKRLSERLSVHRAVVLLESTLAEVPMVIGWLKPVILLPVAATGGLTMQQVDAIIAHELAHVRRWDQPVNLLQSVVETVLFYHPAVWWISSRMRQERENCCDDIASEVCGDRVTYARALLQLEELRHPGSLVLAARGGDLLARIRRLVAPAGDVDGSGRGPAGVVVLVAVGTALTGILLAATGKIGVEDEYLPGAKAVLRDGDLVVEFAALSREPRGESSWWQPNGEPYPTNFDEGAKTTKADYGPSSLHLGFVVRSSRTDIAPVAKFPGIDGGFWSTRSTGPTAANEGRQKVFVAGPFGGLTGHVDVDLLFSLEDWRPWQTVKLDEGSIEPWGTGGFAKRANNVNTTEHQPGDFLHGFEHPEGKLVEMVVVWPKAMQFRAQLQVEAFGADGNVIESVGSAGYQQARGLYFDRTRGQVASYRYRIRYYTDRVSFANASLMPSQPALVAHRVVRLDTPPPSLTPARIADEIEAAMQRFEKVEYTAETTATVNTNGFRTDVEPVLVKGDSSYRYRSDGARWFVDENAFTYNQGESEVRPQRHLAGFDGSLHYTLDRFGHAILGEEDLSNTRLSPRAVFWRAGRTDGWLLAALRRDEAKIESDGIVDGRRVVRIVSDWNGGDEHWRFDIEILPDHSWLPLHTKVTYGDKLVGSESIEELAQTNNGTWYPRRINWSAESEPFATTRSKTTNVTSFQIRDDFKDADFQWEIPLGTAVVDYRGGITYRNDPWFAEMQPWLRDSLDFPPRDLSAMRDFRSYADAAIDGKPAPPLEVADWIVGEDPGSWKNDDGRPTILFFFGGRAISPTPKQLIVLKTLAERYKAAGLEDAGLSIVGVASAGNTPAMTRQAMEELLVNFPVAIDTPNEDGRGYGRTFAAYGLKAYVGIFVIDGIGVVHIVEPDLVPEGSELSALEHVLKNLERGAIEVDSPDRESLTRKKHDSIEAEWKRLASEENGTGRIAGKIELTADGRDAFGLANVDITQRIGAAATIELLPVLGLSDGSAFATLRLIDRDRLRVVTCKADGSFDVGRLRRGEYQVTITAPGMARTQQSVILGNDMATAEVNVLLNQAGEISGTVVDESGMPIAGARISGTKRHFNPDYLPQHTTAHLAPELTTDANGEFVYESLFVGAHTFLVEAAGYEPMEMPLVPAGKQGLKIVLKKSAD